MVRKFITHHGTHISFHQFMPKLHYLKDTPSCSNQTQDNATFEEAKTFDIYHSLLLKLVVLALLPNDFVVHPLILELRR